MLPKTALLFYNAAEKAHETWESQLPERSIIPLIANDSPILFRQEQLVNPAEVAVFDTLDMFDDKIKSFRAYSVVGGSKYWLYCQPAPGLETYIFDRN